MSDDITKMAKDFSKNTKEWDDLVKNNQMRWLDEYKDLLDDNRVFWGTDFTTFTMFKVFEYAFSDVIDECFKGAKDEGVDDLTRKDVAYSLFGRVIEEKNFFGDLKSGGIA